MRLQIALAACLLWPAPPAADAADLARQSPLGAVFADRPARVIIRGSEPIQPPPNASIIVLAPRTPGYYGRPGDYTYGNYYGTSPVTIFSRLPYACGFVGLC